MYISSCSRYRNMSPSPLQAVRSRRGDRLAGKDAFRPSLSAAGQLYALGSERARPPRAASPVGSPQASSGGSPQSSSKIWYVFWRMVSTARACRPASAMLGPVCWPIIVGLREALLAGLVGVVGV